jgi:hypothetical protein
MSDEFTGNPWNDYAETKDCLYTVNAFRPGFHGDLELINVFDKISVDAINFIETGSYHGCTSYFVSKNYKFDNCFSCEINPNNFSIAYSNTRSCKNLKIYNMDSLTFLRQISKIDTVTKQKCVFWLDAHGDVRNTGPIKDEIEFIKNNFSDYIIFVDDMNTPNSPSSEQFDLDWLSSIYDAHSFYYIPTYENITGYSLTGWLLISNTDLGELPNCERYDFE